MQRRRIRVRKFLVLAALGCLIGMTTKAWTDATDDRPDDELGWQVHSGYGLGEPFHLTGPKLKWELPVEKKLNFPVE